jgi:hypothetical protein
MDILVRCDTTGILKIFSGQFPLKLTGLFLAVIGVFGFAFSLRFNQQMQESHQTLCVFAAFLQRGFTTQRGFQLKRNFSKTRTKS